MSSAKVGDIVKVEYVGTLEDGTVFDSTESHGEPLVFKLGEGQIIPGFENAVVGMELGQEKEVKLPPDEAYGQRNPELVKDMPRSSFPEEQEINAGMMFFMNLPNGRQIPVRISNVTEEIVTVDLNPPLAGKTLIFKIKLLEITEDVPPTETPTV